LPGFCDVERFAALFALEVGCGVTEWSRGLWLHLFKNEIQMLSSYNIDSLHEISAKIALFAVNANNFNDHMYCTLQIENFIFSQKCSHFSHKRMIGKQTKKWIGIFAKNFNMHIVSTISQK
jgi:hypothetical protein